MKYKVKEWILALTLTLLPFIVACGSEEVVNEEVVSEEVVRVEREFDMMTIRCVSSGEVVGLNDTLADFEYIFGEGILNRENDRYRIYDFDGDGLNLSVAFSDDGASNISARNSERTIEFYGLSWELTYSDLENLPFSQTGRSFRRQLEADGTWAERGWTREEDIFGQHVRVYGSAERAGLIVIHLPSSMTP